MPGILWNLIPSLITIAFTLILGAIAYGKLSQTVQEVVKDTGENKAYIDKEVVKMQEACGLCQGRICNKIDEVKNSAALAGDKVDVFKQEVNLSMLEISKFMGKIDQFINDFERRLNGKPGSTS